MVLSPRGSGRPPRMSRLATGSSAAVPDHPSPLVQPVQRSHEPMLPYEPRLKPVGSGSSQLSFAIGAQVEPEDYVQRLRHKQQKSMQVVAGWLTNVSERGGQETGPSPFQSANLWSTVHNAMAADQILEVEEEEEEQQHGMGSSRGAWTPHDMRQRSTLGGRPCSPAMHAVQEEQSYLPGPLQVARTVSGDPLLLAGQQLAVSSHTTPHLFNHQTGSPVLAADGSVLQLAPQEPVVAPLARPLPPTVPYLVNSHGTPYGICMVGEGTMYPLAVLPSGEVLWGPDGLPLMVCPLQQQDDCPAAAAAAVQDAGISPTAEAAADAVSPLRALITASGDSLKASGCAAVGVRLHWLDGNTGSTEPATVAAAVDLSSGQELRDADGGPLRLDGSTLELLSSKGLPCYDRQGCPLRLQAAQLQQWHQGPAVGVAGVGLRQSVRAAGAALVAHPGSLLLALGALLVVQFVLRMVLGLSASSSMAVVLVLLAALAAVAGAAALVLARPHAHPLPAPALLDINGRPLQDARGQQLCLAPPSGPLGQPQLVTAAGDPVCLTVEGAQPESVLAPSVVLRRGGPRQDLLLDTAGRPLLGHQGARLKVLLDGLRQPLLSPLGLPLALSLSGTPHIGPDGRPLYTTPDGKLLVGEGGQALLSPAGQMLGLGPHGNLLLADGNPLLGPQRQRVYLGQGGLTGTHGMGGALSSTIGLDAGLPPLRLGPAPVLFSPAGAALTDPLGRPLAAGPLGNWFAYSKSSSSWLWQADLFKTVQQLSAAVAARRQVRASEAGGATTRRTAASRFSPLQTAREVNTQEFEDVEDDGYMESEPPSPGAWPPAAIDYVPINYAGIAVRSPHAPRDGDAPQQHPAEQQQQRRLSRGASQEEALASPVGTRGTRQLGVASSAAGGSVIHTAASHLSTQQQQQRSSTISRTTAAVEPTPSWLYGLDGLLLVIQLSLAQHAAVLSWLEGWAAGAATCQLLMQAASSTLTQQLSTAAARGAGMLDVLASHPAAAQLQPTLTSTGVLLCGLLLLGCWLVVGVPHAKYLDGELAAIAAAQQGTADTAAASAGSTRVSGWWLQAVGAASGASKGGRGRSQVPGGYPGGTTAAAARWCLAAWPLPHAAVAAALLLVVLLQRAMSQIGLLHQLEKLQVLQRRCSSAGGSIINRRRRSQQHWPQPSVRVTLLWLSAAWLLATLCLTSTGVLLGSMHGIAEQQSTLQQLPYLRQAADLAEHLHSATQTPSAAAAVVAAAAAASPAASSSPATGGAAARLAANRTSKAAVSSAPTPAAKQQAAVTAALLRSKQSAAATAAASAPPSVQPTRKNPVQQVKPVPHSIGGKKSSKAATTSTAAKTAPAGRGFIVEAVVGLFKLLVLAAIVGGVLLFMPASQQATVPGEGATPSTTASSEAQAASPAVLHKEQQPEQQQQPATVSADGEGSHSQPWFPRGMDLAPSSTANNSSTHASADAAVHIMSGAFGPAATAAAIKAPAAGGVAPALGVPQQQHLKHQADLQPDDTSSSQEGGHQHRQVPGFRSPSPVTSGNHSITSVARPATPPSTVAAQAPAAGTFAWLDTQQHLLGQQQPRGVAEAAAAVAAPADEVTPGGPGVGGKVAAAVAALEQQPAEQYEAVEAEPEADLTSTGKWRLVNGGLVWSAAVEPLHNTGSSML